MEVLLSRRAPMTFVLLPFEGRLSCHNPFSRAVALNSALSPSTCGGQRLDALMKGCSTSEKPRLNFVGTTLDE